MTNWPGSRPISQAKLDYIVELIATFGLERLPAKYTQHLQDQIWEFRMKGKDGIARALYFTAHAQRIIIVQSRRKRRRR